MFCLSASTEECLEHSSQPLEETIIYTFHYLFIAQKRIKLSKGGERCLIELDHKNYTITPHTNNTIKDSLDKSLAVKKVGQIKITQ